MTPAVQIIGSSAVAVNLAEATPKKVLLIARQTLNTAVRRGRTRVVQLVRQSLNLPSAYVRERTTIRVAQGEQLQAVLGAPKRDVLLSRFSAKPRFRGRNKNGTAKRAGVSVKVKAGGKTERLPGAFLVKLRGGAEGLAIPDKRGGRYSTGNRRFEVLYGPSINQSLKLFRPKIVEELQTYVQGEIGRRIALLDKSGAGNAAA